uniref:Mitochondrial carrier homolog 1 n=1 Tax=Cebus imitator TaxID=2715852 RepID=A0A2K5RQ61_CEBIM
MDGGSGGLGSGDNAPTTEALFVALGVGVTALSHRLLCVKLLIQVGHEPMPPTLETNVLGRKLFTYAKYIVQVDGKIGLPQLMPNALSTVTQGSMKVFPPDEIGQVSNKHNMKTSLKKVVKETSYEMMMQCVSHMLAHPLHVISMLCMAKYSGVLTSIGKIFKEEGLLGFFVGLIPHLLGDVVFLWGCNLLAHFINAYLVDDSFSQALAIRSYTKFVMGITVSMLTYPFLPVGNLVAVNNCRLQAAGWCIGPALPRLQPAFLPVLTILGHLQDDSNPAGFSFHICHVPVQMWGWMGAGLHPVHWVTCQTWGRWGEVGSWQTPHTSQIC